MENNAELLDCSPFLQLSQRDMFLPAQFRRSLPFFRSHLSLKPETLIVLPAMPHPLPGDLRLLFHHFVWAWSKIPRNSQILASHSPHRTPCKNREKPLDSNKNMSHINGRTSFPVNANSSCLVRNRSHLERII